MARLVIDVPSGPESMKMHIYVEGEEIVFDMLADDPEDNYGGGITRIPLEEFKNMFEKLLTVEAGN